MAVSVEDKNEYRLVLGLEIHLHVKTETKMFCGCDANVYGEEPNTHTCPTCLGLPGALPVPNADAVKKAQMLGLALGCTLNTDSRFDRKHYFYPDLPKGYQISQYKKPLCEGGHVILDDGTKIEIERIHLEEDTAKSFHESGKTLVDFNVSGMPLIEIVTLPVITSPEHAVEFSKKLRDLVRFLGISDADMEKGQLRIEPNISMRTKQMEEAGTLPKYKVEIKNINSFRFMEKAVTYEMQRQSELLLSGKEPEQENRGWDEKSGQTVGQRSKEEAHDYRYFPEPDSPPMVFDEVYLKSLKNGLPELPDEIKLRLQSKLGLSENNSKALTRGSGLDILEKFEQLTGEGLEANKVANLLLNRPDFRELSVTEFKARLDEMAESVSDIGVLESVISEVLAENPDAVFSYKEGKESALQFILGQVMRKTQGKAEPTAAIRIIKEKI